MKQSRPAFAPGVVVENVGDQTLVLVGSPPRVVLLSPEAAELLTLIQHNLGKEVEQTAALGELADLGVVEDTSASTLSRRGVIELSAVVGAAGLSTLLLPTAAAASSSEPPPFILTGTYTVLQNEVRFNSTQVPSEADLGALFVDGLGPFGGSDAPNWFRQGFGFPNPNGAPLVGTSSDVDTGDVYTITFTEAPPL